MMRTTLLALMLSLGAASLAFGQQQMSAPDQEIMKIRQAMTNEYAAARSPRRTRSPWRTITRST
jgi:uncharacterized protein HemX